MSLFRSKQVVQEYEQALMSTPNPVFWLVFWPNHLKEFGLHTKTKDLVIIEGTKEECMLSQTKPSLKTGRLAHQDRAVLMSTISFLKLESSMFP